ncbi:M12 family metallo-peptidase [Nitrosopumilus ureiphilus]|uniref:M12 family metallo-peptidase n=1 Tax=Nitrosopumilus ureiphilus TaxID=1470067 RepID=UPI0015CCD2A7|nr:M12 family metallo-peptidase [Nitrosopumilus ureiphilus]
MLYNDLYNRWVDDTRQRHLVHLASGKSLSGESGVAAQLGIANPKQNGYGLSEQDPNHSSYFRNTLFAHEIGHNFGAIHDAQGLSNGDTP